MPLLGMRGRRLVVMEDLSEVARAERLASLAELARIVAHEVKNPLTPIRLWAEELLAALDSGTVSRALLDVLEHEKDFQWNEKLIKHPNVIVTPHIAFYADDSTTRMYLESLYSIHQWQWKETITHAVKPPQVVCDLAGVKK